MPKQITAADVADIIKPNSRVFIQGAVGEPTTLIEALHSDTAKPVNYASVSIPGINSFNPADFHAGAEFTTFFYHSGIAPKHSPPEHTHIHPLHFREIYRFLDNEASFDIALIQVSPPDAEGYCSLGPSVDFAPIVIKRSKIIVAEINEACPPAINAPKIPYDNIDYCIHCNHPLASPAPVTSNDIAEKIADHVSSLVDDGDCIQIGVGKLPGAILRKLNNHRRLGFHSGLLSDEVKTLIESGVITGENKTRDQFKHVTGIVFGSTSLYDWCAAHPDILFRSVDYTHDIGTLSALDNLVSINSVLEVDLLGQANAEWISGKQISSVGGLVDFARGARYSKQGRSIIALPATALGGKQSRIVPRVSPVTVSRVDTDYVVTEFGIAKLYGKSIRERAKALIEIAAPEFRSSLEDGKGEALI